MVTFLPALTMEAFFASQLVDPMSEEFLEFSRRHGMEIVGPHYRPRGTCGRWTRQRGVSHAHGGRLQARRGPWSLFQTIGQIRPVAAA